MSAHPSHSRLLRILAIVLLSISVVLTLLGGIGTSCVAFAAENFGPRMAPLIPVKPIFQVLVVLSVLAGSAGVISAFALGRGRRGAYVLALGFLVVGLVTSAVQYYYSATLRGSTAPNNMRLYITALTLIVFLLLRIPGLWERTGFSGRVAGSGPSAAGELAAIIGGLITLTTPLWAASTHTLDGYNTTHVLLAPLVVAGATAVAWGAASLAASRLPRALVTER